MPHVIETTVFSFDGLSDEAKANARRDYVDANPEYPHDDWWAFDDFVECARLLGIEIDCEGKNNPYPHWNRPKIFFQLHTQGSGASFTGEYRPRATAVADITAHAPKDAELLRIAEQLTVLQVATKLCFGDHLEATITSGRSNDVHSSSMNIEVEAIEPGSEPNRRTHTDGNFFGETEATSEEEKVLRRLMRDFADWMYHELVQQYDWHFSDDALDQELQDGEFHENGDLL